MTAQSVLPDRPVLTPATRTGILVFIAVLVSLIAFRGALAALVVRWIKQEEYSHGFLIPVVTAWLLWTRRDALIASIGRPSWIGVGFIVLAMAMHVVGELSAFFLLSQLGFIVALIGIVLGAGGYSLLKVTLLPIVFLLFAIPLPYFLEANLTLQMQLISSELGAFFIRLFQIPVYLEGNIIDLGTYKLAVVEACSGLRYLFPLLSLGFLAAYLFQAPLWQRAVVFLSTVPITIIMNSIRIGLTGVTMDRWGPKAADGVLHYFEGWVIFIACAGILAAEIILLARFSGKSFADVFDVPKVTSPKSPQSTTRAAAREAPLVTCLLLLGAVGVIVSFTSGRVEILPERSRFASFPTNIGEWQGHASLLDADTERGLNLDDYLLSDYAKPDGKAVNLYVAYYPTQRKGVTPHSPSVCIPGGGWLITSLERTSYAGLGEEFPLNRVIIARDKTRQLVYYWFEERGRKVANEYWAKWLLLVDAIFKNRTDGALVRLTTPIFPGESERDADDRLRSFVREAVPRLASYLPSDTTIVSKSALNRSKGGQS